MPSSPSLDYWLFTTPEKIPVVRRRKYPGYIVKAQLLTHAQQAGTLRRYIFGPFSESEAILYHSDLDAMSWKEWDDDFRSSGPLGYKSDTAKLKMGRL